MNRWFKIFAVSHSCVDKILSQGRTTLSRPAFVTLTSKQTRQNLWNAVTVLPRKYKNHNKPKFLRWKWKEYWMFGHNKILIVFLLTPATVMVRMDQLGRPISFALISNKNPDRSFEVTKTCNNVNHNFMLGYFGSKGRNLRVSRT
mgnify:CR=1 FL=1